VSVYIFTGPTLSAAESRTELDAIYLPPVSQGDVYRVALNRPKAIGIIDGYFERVPAVWHKEILWALSRGIHVFGSASMGALRAAELEQFGMEGVGAVFADYRDGRLEDDDEVAVAHGPAEDGYVCHSEAMVNIRYTLAAATADGVLHEATASALLRLAKATFYMERSYPLLMQQAESSGLPPGELASLRAWLPRGKISQKREDAVQMLRLMRERLAGELPPKVVHFAFAHTDAWESLMRQSGALVMERTAAPEMLLTDMLLDELRLDPDAYRHANQGTLARLLALAETERQGLTVTTHNLQDVTDRFRWERGLLEPAQVDGWRAEHHLSSEQFTRLLHDEVRWRWIERKVQAHTLRLLPDYLRTTEQYVSLLQRSRKKESFLRSRGLEEPGLVDVGLTQDELLRWYFTGRLGRTEVPDLHQYAEELGYKEANSFLRSLLREYLWLTTPRPPEHS
jgi:hypothetical protein